jgi:hypothetical protein
MQLKAAVAACAMVFAAGAAHAGYIFKGNDTGGIISWSPAIAHTYREIAAAHCYQYNKIAFITSIHPVYGDYVGFVCAFPRGYDPVKARYYQYLPVLRSRY